MAATQKNAKMPFGKGNANLAFFLSLFLCVFQIFISFPIAVWHRNKFNFEAPLTHSYSVLGLMLLFITLLSVFIAVLMPRKFKAYFTPALIVLAAAICIQQNFLAWNYGILDGSSLDFKKNASLGYIDAALWIIAFGAAFLASGFVKRQASNILLGVGAVTLIMTGINISSYGPVKTQYTIDERAKFEFSRNKNIILFLFDAYQMDVLLDVANSHPELIEPLEGFTLFENNAAVFAKTYPTIPLFLTGERYQKKQPLLDFFKTAYEDSLMEQMQDEGWDIGLYPHLSNFPSLVNAVDMSPKIMDNVVGGVSGDAKLATYFKALNLSLFRAVPHVLKPAVFNDGEFVLNPDKEKGIYAAVAGDTDVQQPFKFKYGKQHAALGFKDLISEHGALATDDPVFRFYHFMLPHSPFLLDGQLTPVKHEQTFEAYREYSHAALKLMGEYLEHLKAIGAYDNSTILIVSDHGMGAGNIRQYDPSAKDYRDLKKFGYRRASAKSIFLMKPPEKRGALSRSAKPVSGIDVAPTIAAAAGLKTNDFEGKNVEDITPSEARTRLFNFYSFSTWDSKYLEDFEAYEINGDVREQASWKKTGMVKENIQIKNKDSYQIDEVMSFGKDVKTDSDFLNAFIETGKYKVLPNFIEAEDGMIDVSINLNAPPDPKQALLLQFEIYSGEAQDRKIIVNDKEITTFIKPKMRQLNRGFFISPDVHKSEASLNLSFRPVEGIAAHPLRLSSVKLSKLNPKNIVPETNLLTDINALFPVGFERNTSLVSLLGDRTGGLIFRAAPDICGGNRLHLRFKKGTVREPVLLLNNTPLEPEAQTEAADAVFSYNCSHVEIENNNVLEIFIPKADSDNAANREELAAVLETLYFSSSAKP